MELNKLYIKGYIVASNTLREDILSEEFWGISIIVVLLMMVLRGMKRRIFLHSHDHINRGPSVTKINR